MIASSYKTSSVTNSNVIVTSSYDILPEDFSDELDIVWFW